MQRLPLASEFIARKFVRLLLRFAGTRARKRPAAAVGVEKERRNSVVRVSAFEGPKEMRCRWEVVIYSPTSMTTDDDDDNGEDDDLCADRDRAWAEQSHVGGARIHTTTLSW